MRRYSSWQDADDPRCREISDFLRWADRHRDSGDFAEFVNRFAKYTNAIESLADDAKLTKQDRAFAQEMLDQIRLFCRILLPSERWQNSSTILS